MKNCFAAVVVILLVVAVLPAVAAAYSTGTSFPLIIVNNGAGDQFDAHVSGNFASYTEQATFSAVAAIRFFNFTTSTSGAVPSVTNTLDSLSDINGDNIVFTRLDLGNGARPPWRIAMMSLIMLPTACKGDF